MSGEHNRYYEYNRIQPMFFVYTSMKKASEKWGFVKPYENDCNLTKMENIMRVDFRV